MVIIRVNAQLPLKQMEALLEWIYAQERREIIVLPACCELLNEVEAPDGIQIVQQKEDARVAELEKELAAAMAYITAVKSCCTCKHGIPTDADCPCDCYTCDGGPCNGICKICINGSEWEWRGACGNT